MVSDVSAIVMNQKTVMFDNEWNMLIIIIVQRKTCRIKFSVKKVFNVVK